MDYSDVRGSHTPFPNMMKEDFLKNYDFNQLMCQMNEFSFPPIPPVNLLSSFPETMNDKMLNNLFNQLKIDNFGHFNEGALDKKFDHLTEQRSHQSGFGKNTKVLNNGSTQRHHNDHHHSKGHRYSDESCSSSSTSISPSNSREMLARPNHIPSRQQNKPHNPSQQPIPGPFPDPRDSMRPPSSLSHRQAYRGNWNINKRHAPSHTVSRSNMFTNTDISEVRRADRSQSLNSAPPLWNSKNMGTQCSPREVLSCPQFNTNEVPIYSRKLFVGGIPVDAPNEEVEKIFRSYGPVICDWPREPSHPKENKKYPQPPPKLCGYVFLVYEYESSVHALLKNCVECNGKYFLTINGRNVKHKPAQIRPWLLSSIDFISAPQQVFQPHRTVFIGGVPRTCTARDLAHIMEEKFGAVVYVGIDIDPELMYPKGAARVVFADDCGYVNAIKGRFVKVLNADEHKKEAEIKPYVLDDVPCNECSGEDGPRNPASFFCGVPCCLQYYCHSCWLKMHPVPNGSVTSQVTDRSDHIPLVRVGEQTKLLSELLPQNAPRQLVERYIQIQVTD